LAREHNIDAVARQHEAGDPFDVMTRMVTAFIPSLSTAESVARWPEPVILKQAPARSPRSP
jgi:hypothetical protein